MMIILGVLRHELASPPPAGADSDNYSEISAPRSGSPLHDGADYDDYSGGSAPRLALSTACWRRF